jgi:hypothetical protein
MKTAFKIIGFFLLTLVLVVLHIFFKEFLPYPWVNFNFLFLMMIWLTIAIGTTQVLWLTLLPAFIIELFSSTPFGLQSIAIVVSIAILNWILLNVFTNHSVLIVLLAGLVGIIIYRSIFVVFYFLSAFLDSTFSITSQTLIDWGWEAFFTTLWLTLFYVISSLFIKKFKPHYIK